MTSVPRGAVIGASPVETPRNRRSNGLRREASTIASFTLAPRALNSARIVSMLDAVAPHFGFGPDLRIDRDQVGLSSGLNPIAAEEEDDGRSRA